jgi:predicted nuclease of predicted toxin-antitoxin system
MRAAISLLFEHCVKLANDVTAIAELSPAAQDDAVLHLARFEKRILLTEDKDFGLLAFAGGQQTAGVVLIRFPSGARSQLSRAIVNMVLSLEKVLWVHLLLLSLDEHEFRSSLKDA